MGTVKPYLMKCERGNSLSFHKPDISIQDLGLVLLGFCYALLLGGVSIVTPWFAASPLTGDQKLLVMMAGAGLIVAATFLARLAYHRATRGVWTIDWQGIEFRSDRGEHHRLEWDGVRRVLWGELRFILRGDTGRISVNRGDLSPGDWEQFRGRVETMLSGRFDLTLNPPPVLKIRWLRVIGFSIPCVAPTILSLKLIPSLGVRQSAAVLLIQLFLLAGLGSWTCGMAHREAERRNPTWRVAKRKPDDWDSW